MGIDGFQQKSAENVVNSIKDAIQKATGLQIMTASNAFGRGFAEKKLTLIVDALPELQAGAWDKINAQKLLAIDGIGEVLAQQFADNMMLFAQFLRDNDIVCNISKPRAITKKTLANVTVVFTNFRDATLEAYVTSNGGRVASNVTGSVTVVVNGYGPRRPGKLGKRWPETSRS
eukprot:gene19687-26374_t